LIEVRVHPQAPAVLPQGKTPLFPFPIEYLGGLVTETIWTFGRRDKVLFGIRTPHCTARSPVAIMIVTAITKIE
jgi:hypothetical protein